MSRTPEEMEKDLEASKKQGEELVKGMEALKKQMEGLQGVHAGWSTEIGEFRKQATAMIEQMKTAGLDPKKIQEALDKITELEKSITSSLESGSKGKGGGNEGEDKKLSERLTTLKKNMTKEQRETADAAFKKLPEDVRVKIRGNKVLGVAGDAKQELLFLEAAINAQPFVPESLFDEPANESEDGNPYEELFSGAARKSNHLPGARRKGASGFAGSEQQTQINESESKLHGGIPRPAPK